MRRIFKKNWDDLAQIWQELYDKSPFAMPFQSYQFLSFTGKGKPQRNDLFRLIGLKELNLVLVNDGEVTAIAPLQFKKKKERYTVYFRGHFTTASQLDFIFQQDWTYEDFAFLMDGIQQMLGDVSFFLDRVSERSPTCKYLQKYLSAGVMEKHDCYAVPVPQNYDAWFGALHKHFRKNLLRREKLLAAEHKNVQYKIICRNIVDKKTSAEMMGIYAQRFLEKNNFHFGLLSGVVKHVLTWVLLHDKMTQWLNKDTDNFHLILYADNQIAAFHSGLICKNNKIVFSRLAINSRYARYGPGGLMMCCLMKYITEQNLSGSTDIREFDLGQGGDNGMEYKKSQGGMVYFMYTFIDS